ncbi:MAG: hypothetical protein ACK4TP_18425 [Hyphomicrobium sp.]|jgi:hypothetical protein
MTMIRKLVLAAVMLALAAPSAVAPAVAEDPPPAANTGAQQGAEPDDPDGQPYPPDGVTDPNAVYPTDGPGDTTDQGEAAAAAPGASPPGNTPPD